ncbi:hypothetical protein B484DRAFT_410068 [Ochromonadaceae sp. CCMP2298]|nr:hypothetical protein B484DRAFT_410068 [Ochromonadaceae sp. CCMP2298]
MSKIPGRSKAVGTQGKRPTHLLRIQQRYQTQAQAHTQGQQKTIREIEAKFDSLPRTLTEAQTKQSQEQTQLLSQEQTQSQEQDQTKSQSAYITLGGVWGDLHLRTEQAEQRMKTAEDRALRSEGERDRLLVEVADLHDRFKTSMASLTRTEVSHLQAR